MKFKKGDKVVMVNCGEGEHYAGKVWTCSGDSFKDNNKEEVVFLEGFSGYFHCRFLVKPYKDEGSVVTLPCKDAVEVLKAYRDTSIYTVNALKVAIDDIEQSLASNVYDSETKSLMQERVETLQNNLDVIECDPE